MIFKFNPFQESSVKSGGCGGDRTPGSSQKKMHKKSPKKYPGSSSKGRKARDRAEKNTRRHLRLDSSDNDEASERESDEITESPFFQGSRQAASKQAGGAITNKSKISRVKEESSSSQSEDDEDLKLRKREHHQHGKEKAHHHKSPSVSSKYHKNSPLKAGKHHQAFKGRSQSPSENSDIIMPELEPQVTKTEPVCKPPILAPSSASKAQKKLKLGKEKVQQQKSIREFFGQKSGNASSASSQEEEVSSKFEQRLEKVQKHAIEKSYAQNKDFLKSFETFQKTDLKDPSKREDSKPFTLIASTLHPKKVLKEELKKEKKREEERKKCEEEVVHKRKKVVEDDKAKNLKRKEREWEEAREKEREEKLKKEKSEKKKREKEERKRQDREERERLEREKENIRLKEQMLERKKLQREEERERNKKDLEKTNHPLPISSPKKVGYNPKDHEAKEKHIKHKDSKPSTGSLIKEKQSTFTPPSTAETATKSNEKDAADRSQEIKTPKKLRKLASENESPDPKKNFIKKHQEEQEKLHQETVLNKENSVKEAAPAIFKEHPLKLPPPSVKEINTKDPREAREVTENSLWENLGYNSGDDVSRYSDDHLNKQLIVKPNTVLAKDGSEDEEKDKDVAKEVTGVTTKTDPVLENNNKPPVVAAPPVVAEQKPEPLPDHSDVVMTEVKPQENETNSKTESECIEAPKMSDCMMEQQQQQNVNNSMEQPQQQQPILQQQPVAEQQQMQIDPQQHMMDQCAVAQQHKMQEQQVMEQHQNIAMMDQQQQQQQWSTEMAQTGAGYDGTGAQYGASGAMMDQQQQQPDAGPSLGVYTPDSSTNSVHSLHGYSGGLEAGGEAGTGAYGQPGDTGYSGDTGGGPADGVTTGAGGGHNTSVMESPSSIASVEAVHGASGGYTDHSSAMAAASQSHGGQMTSADLGAGPHHHPDQSPHNSISQSPAPTMVMTGHSPHHSQQQSVTPISQSPHPIQSPHPPMQPSPHHSQSHSPHPHPYTNLPHQSPTGAGGYVTPAPPQPQRSSSAHSSKSPRAPSSRSSQQQQQQQQLQQQHQRAQQMQQAQLQLYANYGMTHELAGKAGHRGYPDLYTQHTAAAMYHYPAMTALGHPAQPAATPTHHLAQLQKQVEILPVAAAGSGGHMGASGHAPSSGSKQAKSSKRGSGGGGQGGANPSAAAHGAGLGLAVPPGYMAPHQYPGQQLAPGAGQVGRATPAVSGQRAGPAPGASMATMQQYMHHAATQQQQYNAAMLYSAYAYDNRGMGGYPHPSYPTGYYGHR